MIDRSITGPQDDELDDPRKVENRGAFAATDLVATIGAALVTAGVALVHIPAAFVVLGGLLLAYAIAASRTETPT